MNTKVTLQNGQQFDLADVIRDSFIGNVEYCLRMKDGSFVTITSSDEIGWISYLLGGYRQQKKNDKQLVEKYTK